MCSGPPGSGSVSSEVRIRILLYHKAKLVRKTLIPVLWLLNDILFQENDVKCTVKKQFFVGVLMFKDERIRIHWSEARIRGSGSVPNCHESTTLPFTLRASFFCSAYTFPDNSAIILYIALTNYITALKDDKGNCRHCCKHQMMRFGREESEGRQMKQC